MEEVSTPYSRIMAIAARKMRADFEDSGEIVHDGEMGSVREHDLLAFLKQYIPRNVEVAGSAEIIATDGEVSNQTDVVIYDPSAPPLFNRGGYRIIPIECVYATIEVKSRLDRPKMLEAQEKVARVKRMPKMAYFTQLSPTQVHLYGKIYDGFFPVFSYVFAYDGIGIDNFIDDEAIARYRTQPYEERIDGAWILGKGGLNWLNPETRAPNPNAGPGLWPAVFDEPEGQGVLLNMILNIASQMAQVFMPPLNMIKYADQVVMMDNTRARGPVEFEGGR